MRILLRFISVELVLCLLAAAANALDLRQTEAESVSGGTVIQDPDASGSQAVTRSDTGTYTWWYVPIQGLPSGDYAVYIRARSIDGKSHNFGEHVVINEATDILFDQSISLNYYKWYRVGVFSYPAGALLRLSDWSAQGLVVDQILIDKVLAVEAENVNTNGSIISDSNASGGKAVYRGGSGIYAWWSLPSNQIDSADYTVYVRTRSVDGGSHNFGEHVVLDERLDVLLNARISATSYRWYELGSFHYSKGASIRLSDWSEGQLLVDKLRLVRDTPPTLNDYSIYSWSRINDMPANIGTFYGAALDKTQGRIYLVGGYSSNTAHVGANTVLLGELSGSGVGIDWKVQPNYPVSVLGNATFTNGKKVYVFGGDDGNGTILRDSYVANISLDGQLEAWKPFTPLPLPLHFHAIVNHNNIPIIVAGRTSNDQPTRTIYRLIGNNWEAVGQVPRALSSPAVTIYDGYIYVAGGSLQSNQASYCLVGELYYAPISADGHIGSWKSTSRYPAVMNFWDRRMSPGIRSAHHIRAYGGYMYAFPAASFTLHSTCSPYYDDKVFLSSTLRTLKATLYPDGSLGEWREIGPRTAEFDRNNFLMNAMPSNVYGLVMDNSKVYMLGGMNYTGMLGSVYSMDLSLHGDPIPLVNK